MAKQKKFKLVHHDPFIFEGEKGTYEVPPLESIAYDAWKDVAQLAEGNIDAGKMLDAYKQFFLAICPDLEQEQIGDNQWLQFGSVYFEAMGE